jgi:hypothetical protein
MPLIATRGSASAVSFGFLSAQSKLYWVGLLGGAVNTLGFTGAYDSTGAFVVGGQSYGATNNVGQLAKFSPTGGLIWQKNVVPTTTYTNPSIAVTSLAVGDSDKIYAGVNGADGANNQGFYAQCTAEGVLEQARVLTSAVNNLLVSGGSITRPISPTPPSTSSPIVSVLSGGISNSRLGVTRFNAATGSRDYLEVNSLRINSMVPESYVSLNNYNYIIGGQNRFSADVFLGDLDDSSCSGRQIASVGFTTTPKVSFIGGAIYAGHVNNSAAALYRFNSVFAGPVWSRRFSTNADFQRPASDTEGNIYACTNTGLLVKYSASGVLQWQRTFTCAGGSVFLTTVVVDADDTIGVVGSVLILGAYQLFVARVPSTGGATNTVNVGGVMVTYAASSFTEDTAATTWSSASYDVTTSSGTLASNSTTTTATTLGVAVERL